jgi:hypothetical protein
MRLSLSSKSKTGISSTAVIPRERRYGTFSTTPANVPGCFAAELGERVKPPTCIS